MMQHGMVRKIKDLTDTCNDNLTLLIRSRIPQSKIKKNLLIPHNTKKLKSRSTNSQKIYSYKNVISNYRENLKYKWKSPKRNSQNATKLQKWKVIKISLTKTSIYLWACPLAYLRSWLPRLQDSNPNSEQDRCMSLHLSSILLLHWDLKYTCNDSLTLLIHSRMSKSVIKNLLIPHNTKNIKKKRMNSQKKIAV